MQDLRPLMAPSSVAVVGATERADASASYVMRNLLRLGYQGRIVPIHPRAREVFGIPARATLDEPVDAVVIAIAAEHAVAALEAAARAGARAAIVLASGFAEQGTEGIERQRRLREIARHHDIALCGPNCLGLVNLATGAALYSSTLSTSLPRGHLAILSHSGAAAIALTNTGRFGLSHIVSAGNSAATDLADYLDHLAADPQTKVAGLVLEAIADPSAMARAMARMHAADKRVIVLRAGRTSRGAQATAAHTGALAGAHEAYRAFFRREGIIEVADMDGFTETAELCLKLRAPSRRGVAILGVSGGGVAHVADIASEVGLELPDLAPETVARLRAVLPDFATPQNPLDITGIVFANPGIYRDVLRTLSADPAIGLIVASQDAPAGLDDAGAAEYFGIADAVAAHDAAPIVFLSNLSSGHHPAIAARLASVPVLRGTRPALTAIHALLPLPLRERAGVRGEAPTSSRATEFHPSPIPSLKGRGEELRRQITDSLPLPRHHLARTAAAAAQAATRIGYPVALKIDSPDIPHKTEAGGVILAIPDEAAVRAAFETIMARARAYAPHATLDGVLVQEMVPHGIEALVGLVRHPPFGLGLVVGTGGTLVELADDIAFDLLPLDHAQADALIARTRLATLLAGYRGAPQADRPALADLLVKLSKFAATHGDAIEALDLNPVAVLPLGRGVRVLDVLSQAAAGPASSRHADMSASPAA